mmetsp:Transcript_106776/g.298892  ORF Transcript_106776/g.298892 Transcript_106776/m.298892 type:complete len:463 (+) Transcript_106776:69-1457(+)
MTMNTFIFILSTVACLAASRCFFVSGFVPLALRLAAPSFVGNPQTRSFIFQPPHAHAGSEDADASFSCNPNPNNNSHRNFLREALSFSHVFTEFDAEETDTLIQSLEPVDFPAGRVICRQGQRGDYFYIIQEGTVQYSVDGNDVAIAGPSQSFGELALFDKDGTRAATVTAITPVKAWCLDRETFSKSLKSQERLQTVQIYAKRVELKKKLQLACIQSHYNDKDTTSSTPCNYCEDLMEELEQLKPIARPAYHPSMNGDWCMVQAGASTLDMALITILSTLSRAFKFAVDFTDFRLTLKDDASMVEGSLFLELFGSVPFRVDTFTEMTKDHEVQEGTLMYEKFKGFSISGISLSIPFLDMSRPLNITYLDEDIMIARNGVRGEGAPHLLVKIQHCAESTPDHQYTGFFEEARLLYGDRISRCLVDRRFGDESEEEKIRKLLEKARSLSVSNTRDRLQWSDKR